MHYRKDIDGLRSIAVLSVIFYHAGFSQFSGGFIGVDVFFVISGYLITGLVYQEVKSRQFTFSNFYKRRVARLLPALIITLLLTYLLCFLFYDNNALDNLGKEMFFSALGLANLLFAQGSNYFASETSVRPFIHLWSLGVEEQFYLVWPIILLALGRWKTSIVFAAIGILFTCSLIASEFAAIETPTKAYFLPQYRAFELLFGAVIAINAVEQKFLLKSALNKELGAVLGMVLIVTSIYALDRESTFPGLNALWPCLGSALLIACAEGTQLGKLLSRPVFVGIGLISYPLYLYHQPIISFLELLGMGSSAWFVLTVSLSVGIPLSWLTYRYIEKPVRKFAHTKRPGTSTWVYGGLVSTTCLLAVVGLYTAKNAGLSWRFKVLNPFAHEISENIQPSFHKFFKRGYQVNSAKNNNVLFVGDSVLQQYVVPIAQSMNIPLSDIDTVTRGGCVLLKGVEFRDQFSDISCNDLRKSLYESKRHYKTVVISQSWSAYQNDILNQPPVDKNKLERWSPFVKQTIKHFSGLADNIVVIGEHPTIRGYTSLEPNILQTSEHYQSSLDELEIENFASLAAGKAYFNRFQQMDKVLVIHPVDIWCNEDKHCTLHNGQWAYFKDTQHITSAANDFAVKKLSELLEINSKLHLARTP